jgi:hypothetical protein
MLALEYAVAPLDVARRAALRLATRSEALTSVLGRRDTRIAALGSAQVLLLLCLTMRSPVAMYFVGPVLFGVVHIAAGVRYLVLRLAVPRAFLVGSLVLGALLTLVRLCIGMHVANATLGARADTAIGVGWVALGLLLRVRDWPSRLAVSAGALGVGWIVVAHALLVDLLLVHLHNVAAFVIWVVLFRARRGWAYAPVVLAVLGVLLLASGVALPWTRQHDGLLAFGARASRLAAGLTPGARPELAAALLGVLVFLQSVHYAVWTSWIPQDCLVGEGTPTFRMSVRSLVADFGPVALTLIVLAVLAFAVAAVVDVRLSVSWYMALARAHVWLELAVLAYFAGRTEKPGTCPAKGGAS